MNSRSTQDNSPVNAHRIESDWLPSLNLIYQITEALNVRAAVSRTVTRPELREYAPTSFFEFRTGQDIYGNPNLRRALSTNYDLRVEYFPNPGEVLAVSFFRKDIENAIEQIQFASGSITSPQLTWVNSDKAHNTGVELEVRKSFSFIDEMFSEFS